MAVSYIQECEYCRLNSECFLNETETKKCQEFCGSEDTPDVLQKSTMRSHHLLNHYGQVLYSQFIGESVCYGDTDIQILD